MHILTVSWSFENLLRNKQRIQCQNSGVPPRKSLRTKQSSDPSAWTAAQTTSPLPPSPKNTSSLNLQRNKYQFLTFDNLLQSSKKSHPLGSHQPLQTKTHLNQDPRITIPMSKLGRNRIKERRKKKKKTIYLFEARNAILDDEADCDYGCDHSGHGPSWGFWQRSPLLPLLHLIVFGSRIEENTILEVILIEEKRERRGIERERLAIWRENKKKRVDAIDNDRLKEF